MKKHKQFIYFSLVLVIGALFNSCVSSGKYQSALDDIARMRMDSTVQANKIADIQYDKAKNLTEANQIIRQSKDEIERLMTLAEERKKLLDNISDQLHAAIPTINNENFETYTDDNFLHIELPHRVLFNTGEAQLTDDGRNVVEQIASTIRDIDSDIIILGHADNVPYVSSTMNNWDLSFNRAESVMKVMVDQGIAPDHLILAGRGNQEPFIENTSQIGRLLSRRIEIILMPDMHEMESLLKQVSENVTPY